MRRMRVPAVVGFFLVVGARAAVGCGGDDGGAAAPDSFDANLPERVLEDPDSQQNPPPDPDATSNPDAAPPSFCDGIVFYASFDQGFAAERGGTPATPFGFPALSAEGKFAGSVSLRDDGGAGTDGAAIYYYTPPDGGVAWYPEAAGTVSLWYRGTMFENNQTAYVWRAMGSIPPAPVQGGGILFGSLTTEFGLSMMSPGDPEGPILVVPRASVRPFTQPGTFNHLVGAWRRGDGGGPSAVLMVNGGTGTTYDAGPDAPSYADAQPNEAGDLLVPYRAYRGRTWNVDTDALAFRLGGTQSTSPDGEVDDVVVWNRVLSFTEMEDVYKANAPVGDICKLR